MEVMEIREEIDDASSDEELRPILQSCRDRGSKIIDQLAEAFQEGHMDDAKSLTTKLRYWKRIEETIVEKISSID